ncbi:phage tail fiber protein [Klebsiella pneumoniae]|uniref:phage tail fiber domain-containing protein n=1 Tax=Klebsiella pneumoniae TaxID=573 RepID=UPI0035A58589
MTVSTQVSRNEYTGNGATTQYDFTFRILDKSHLLVQTLDTSENIVTLTLGTDYTVTGVNRYNGGKVVLTSALPAGYKISIERSTPVTQEASIRNQGGFFPEIHEDAFDKLTMLVQQAYGWWSGLSLRKPSWLANYYDALNNRIRNLRDPSQAQDAATKNYVDVQIVDNTNAWKAGDAILDQKIDTNFNKSLRVPEATIGQVPPVSQRSSSILGFNNEGNPVPIFSWTATADLAIKLASNIGATLIGYNANEQAALRTVYARLKDFVSLHDYWYPTDGTDYAPALNKALSVSPNVLIPPGKHYLKSTVSLISGTRLIGLGPNCILSSPEAVSSNGAEMITVLRTTGASDILLQGLTIEGGCSEIVSTKRAVRGVRFIECQDVRVIDCEVNNTGDWALSFEKNDRVSVSRYKHRGTVVTNLNGGRDGLHFLDCVDFSATDLDIVSGDDMVGCTSETRDQRNASIKGVRGYSGIGSCVIFNEEGTTTNSTVNVMVEDVRVTNGQTVRNVVRVESINGANVTGVIIRGIRGTGRNHGIQVTSAATMTNVDISDVNVTSVNQHGVYLTRINNLRASGRGTAKNRSFDGWNIASCNYFDVQPAALSSPGWGVQVLNSAYFTMNGNCYNNGSGLFASNAGGNANVNGCSNYNINGVYAGGSSTSYYGLRNDEVPTGRVDPATVCNGFVPRSRPRNINALRDPYAACSFGQTVSGSISSQGAVGCSIELVSDGRYKINFTTPFESTFYRPEIVAQIMNQDLIVRPIAKDVNYFTFEVRNSSGPVMANFILCEFKKAV